MKIGIFGGSFNPIHKGHIKIAKYSIETLNLDKLFFVPCYKRPFNKDREFVSAIDRINMINLVLDDPRMELSTFEIDRKGISYTIETVKYFKNKYPNDELYLIVGSDNLIKLPKWKNIDEICQLAKLCIFKRKNNVNKTNIKKFNGLLLDNPIYNESSTNFIKGNWDEVEEEVMKYIGKNKIYFNEILKQTLSEKRYIHSIRAKEFAIELAKSLKYDVNKASFSAFVHDIAKEVEESKAREIIKKYVPKNENIAKYKLHQELGYVFLKFIFLIDDEEICNSVRYHTSLNIELTLLDKIVFMADKLCNGRKWEGIQKIRKLALEDFEQAFKFVVNKNKNLILAKNVPLTEEQKEIYNKWS